MGCPSCGARFYVLARIDTDDDDTVHACQLMMGNRSRPLCAPARPIAFTTLTPGYKSPLGPDEARVLVTCGACRAAITPARRNAFVTNEGEQP